MSELSWSFSHYSMALQCLRKYKYVALDKIVPVGPESSDLIFGSALHAAINASLTGQDGRAVFEQLWLQYETKDVEYGRYKWNELATIGTTFINNFVKYHAKHYELEFAEKRLYAEYRGIKLEGTMDYYGLYKGRKSLRDFKTSGQNYKPEKASIALQLYLYTYLALQNLFDAPETLGYTVFNKGTGSIQDLTWEFDEKVMYQALDNMVDYLSILSKPDQKFPGNYGACLDYNRKCPFFDKCHKEE